MLCSLRERLFLHHRLVVFNLGRCKELWSVIVILHIGNFSAEKDLLSNSSALHWVGQNIARSYIDAARIFCVFKVLLDFHKVSLVGIGSLHGMLHYWLRFEGFFVTRLDLALSILFTAERKCRRFPWIITRDVAWCREEHLVDSWTFLNIFSGDVSWVYFHFSWILSLFNTSYSKRSFSNLNFFDEGKRNLRFFYSYW